MANALGQTNLFSFHPGLGLLAVHKDVNGVTEGWQYDGFGRLKSVVPIDGETVALRYTDTEAELGTLGIRLTTQYADGQTSAMLYDPYLKEHERDSTGFDGRTISTNSSYNGQGLIAERDGPCFLGDPACSHLNEFEKYTYDELGRLTTLQYNDLSTRKWTYSGLKVLQSDEDGNQSYTVRNQLDKVVNSVANTDQGREVITTFGYGPFAVLNTITDAQGHTTFAQYDIRGRPNGVTDPDTGTHTYRWNAFGELISDQHNNDTATRFTPDVLGRVSSISSADGTTTINWDVAQNGVGRIANVASPDGITTTYTYDPEAVPRCQPGTSMEPCIA